MKSLKNMNVELGNVISTHHSSFRFLMKKTVPPVFILTTLSIVITAYFIGIKNFLLFLVITSILLIAIMSFVLYLLKIAVKNYPVIVFEKGICGYNSLGNKVSVLWEDIYKIEPFKALGLEYINIFYKEEKFACTVPYKWLDEEEKFNKSVINNAGAEHILSSYLKTK